MDLSVIHIEKADGYLDKILMSVVVQLPWQFSVRNRINWQLNLVKEGGKVKVIEAKKGKKGRWYNQIVFSHRHKQFCTCRNLREKGMVTVDLKMWKIGESLNAIKVNQRKVEQLHVMEYICNLSTSAEMVCELDASLDCQ